MLKSEIVSKVRTGKDLKKLTNQLKLATDQMVTVTLVIDTSFEEYCTDLGRVMVKLKKYDTRLKDYFLSTGDDDDFYKFVGELFLGQMLPYTYFVRDDKNKKVYKIKA